MEVNVRFPADSPCQEMVGLALDTRAFILKLNRFISHEVFLDNQCIYQKEEHRPKPIYYVRFILDSSLRYNGRGKTELYGTSKLEFSNMQKTESLSISAKDNKRELKQERSSIEDFLDSKGLLPPVLNKIAVEMVYGGPFSYVFTFRYQDYDPINSYFSEKSFYPVSVEQTRPLKFPQWHLWRFFTSPVYWFQKSYLFAYAIDHIAKKIPLDDIVEFTYPNKEKRQKYGEIFKQQLQEVVPLAYVFIEAYVNQKELAAGIEHLPSRLQPFVLYKKEFLNQIRKSILHFSFHGTDEEIDNIIYGYNKDYVPVASAQRGRRVREISFGDFLKGNAHQDYTKRMYQRMKADKIRESDKVNAERMEKTGTTALILRTKSTSLTSLSSSGH